MIALSIKLSGGEPVRLVASSPKYEERLDGLIIGGGTDLYPPLFDNDPKPDYVYDRPRDRLELDWLKRAQDRDLPTLGICRGAQLMNVERGGSLHMDLAKVYENASYPSRFLAQMLFRKAVQIKPDSQLYRIIGKERLCVNSMHKQAIDQLGEGLVVSAVEDNGIVQALEDPKRPFFMGVQFHPEALIYQKTFRRLFQTLIEKAARRT